MNTQIKRLKARCAVPYGGGFTLNLPEKGMVGSGTAFEALLHSIAIYRKANAIPVGLDFENEVELAVCEKYPAECSEQSSSRPRSDLRLDWRDVLRGTKLMVRQKLSGTPLVEESEAIRRASICLKCPWNVPVSRGCWNCEDLEKAVSEIIGARTIPQTPGLQSCGICHCYLKAGVWVDLDLQWSVLSDKQKEQFKQAHEDFNCWKLGQAI